MTLNYVRLKKGEDRRIRAGHPWIFSNEIDTSITPLKSFAVGEEVLVQAYDKSLIGIAYINPHSLIAGRLFTRNNQERLDTDFFQSRIAKALALRNRLFDRPYYRLIFSEADFLPGVVIDRYDRTLVIQINTAGMEHKKDALIAAIRLVLPEVDSILFRNDSAIREQEGLAIYVETGLGKVPEDILVEENRVRFYAPLLKGQKTGWFYDHRANRARLQEYVKNKQVLDVFSYLGGFGIQAATYGAEHVDCIDASSLACEYINRNAALNNVADKVTSICDDAFDALKALQREKKQYDVIIVDPPAFIKRSKDKKEGTLAYLRLNELALKLLAPGGVLFSCSCSMHISMDELTNVVSRAAGRLEIPLRIIERGHQGLDHPVHPAIPETDYLKAIVAVRE